MPRIRKGRSLASDLRHLVTIQTYSPIPDGEGGQLDQWINTTTTWAGVNPIKGDHREDYASISAEVTHLIKIRGNVEVNDTQRIYWDNRIFDIHTVENVQERDIFKVLICEEKSRV